MAPSRSGSADPPRALRVALASGPAVAPGHEAALVAGDPDPAVLVGGWAGGGAIVAACPLRRAAPGDDPFALLADPGPAPLDAPPGFVGGGWLGYLGYGLVDGPARRPRRLPDAVLGFYDHLLRRDDDGAWWFEALWTPSRDAGLRARRATLTARLAAGVPAPGPIATDAWRATPGPAGHGLAVSAARRRIAAGDLFQANVALRLQSRLHGTPADLFARAASALGPDRAAYLAGDWGAVASLSPELFLTRRGDVVRTRPIKGTRPRDDGDPAGAAAVRDELVQSAKDRAENVMIVDLMRNDLGRVARPGTVEVTELAAPHPGPGVWHLVSEVRARLRDGVGDAELLAATFPPGSVTGAPKVAAVQAIDELESSPREVFTGAIGIASPAAGLELSVVIRTFETDGDRIWLDVGGGIVADSDPSGEAAEAHEKAAPLLAAIGAGLAPAATVSPAPVPRRLGPRPAPRPDPSGGLLETIGLRDGRPLALAAHLRRLAASMGELYGTSAPAGLSDDAARAAAAAGAGRLRLLAGPDGAVRIEAGPAPAPTGRPETLAPVTVPGGLGAHKWADRRWLDALVAACAPDVPLLVDLDGHLLEAASMAVLVVDAGGVLRAPPLDGRVLPSVTRELALAAARADGVPVAVGPIPLGALDDAAAVLLASAVRGLRAAGPDLDGWARRLAPGGNLDGPVTGPMP